MTPEEHNKYLGVAHVAYAGIHVLLMLVMAVVFAAMAGVMARDTGADNGPPAAFFGIVMAAAAAINLVLAIPSFIAGYAFLKRKPWAKTAGIVAAVLSALRIPFGTAVSIYTFWFLFSEPGRLLYENPSRALPPMPPGKWPNVRQASETDARYVPPASPPDWR